MQSTSGSSGWSFFQKYKALIIGGAIVLLLLVFVGRYAIKQSILSDANRQEAVLNGQFEINKAQLGNCITKIRETAGVAKGATKALDTVLTHVISARYDQPNGPQVESGKAFSLLVERYPDTAGLQKNFDKVMIVITGCRDDFQGYQEKLRKMATEFDAWRTGSWLRRTLGKDIPNDNLEATVLDENGSEKLLTGKDALRKMSKLVTVHDASVAYQSGELTPEEPFGDESKD